MTVKSLTRVFATFLAAGLMIALAFVAIGCGDQSSTTGAQALQGWLHPGKGF